MLHSSHLHKFSEDAKKSSDQPNEPPNAISARALDDNFASCLPMDIAGNNSPYRVIAQSGGWRLEPAVEFDVCENGVAVKYRFMAARSV